MNQYLVYALLDPRTKEVRYIGKSGSGLHRPQQHLKAHTYNKSNSHKNCWVRSLVKAGTLPLVHILSDCSTEDQAYQAEIDYIELYRHLGARLTNHNKGGKTGEGGRASEETKAKMSASRKGRKRSPRSKEWSDKIRLKLVGRKQTPEARARMSAAGAGVPENPEAVKRRAASRRRLYLATENGRPVAVYSCLSDVKNRGYQPAHVSSAAKSGKKYRNRHWFKIERKHLQACG